MKTAERLVRRFALSEALYRGTALAANLILISIIATEKGFGTEGVLISSFIQFLISGLLEIPTGRFADRKGWYKSVHWGLNLKVLTTLCYVGAVICVYSIGTAWAWALIAAESIIDSFANAFINGAYQAAYAHWYDYHIEADGIDKASAPPLFVASYRYSLLLRLLLPISALVMGTLIFRFSPAKGSALPVYLGLLIYVLALRFIVIYRTASDLKPLASRQIEDLKSMTYPPLIEIVEDGLNSLLLYAFSTLIMVVCGFYFYGEIYRSLASIVPGVGALWTGGTLIGLLINMGGIVMSRGIVRRAEIATDDQIKKWIPAAISVLSFVSLGLLLFYNSERIHVAILFVYCLITMTAGNVIQRWIVSHETGKLNPAIRATWLSAGEVIGLLAFGFLAGLSILSDIPRAGLWTLLIFLGLGGFGLSLWGIWIKPEIVGAKITLKQYLGVSVIGTACAFFIVMSVFDARSFVQTSRTIKQDGHRLVLQVLKSGLREPVIQGSLTEAAARLNGIVQGRKDICIELALEGGVLGDCGEFKKKPGIEHFVDNIYFDQASQNLAAKIHLYGDYSDIQSRARQRFVIGLFSYMILGGILFLVIVLSSRRIFREITLLLDPIPGAKPKFLIREFRQLGEELAVGQKHKEDSLLFAATAEIARQVAHDIRSPLSALEIIAGDVSQLPEDKRILIRSAVGRIRDIANSLMEKNKASGAGMPVLGDSGSLDTFTPQLLSSLIESLITEKRLQFRARSRIVIESWLDAPSYGIFSQVHPVEFKRVLSNLINNSVEAFGDNPGSVRVNLSSLDDRALVSVHDDGKGIPSDILTRLGRRGETYGKAGGSGLGLYHARTSAKSWGGHLQIQSDVGKGTQVILDLPLAKTPEWFISELSLIPGHPVVILDDDASIHQIWQGRFNSLQSGKIPFEIIHAFTPAEIRAWVREPASKTRQALYLIDFELLGYQDTGLSLAEELGIGKNAVLVTSRYEEASVLEGCRKLGTRMIPKGLAGLVPIRIKTAVDGNSSELWDAVLIDDDPLTRAMWKDEAEKHGKTFKAFSTVGSFLKESGGIDRRTPLYIDVNLGNGVSGVEESLRIHELGFSEIYLATGHSAKDYADLKYLRGVIGKDPPWDDEPPT